MECTRYKGLEPCAQESILRNEFSSIAILNGYLLASPIYDNGIDIILVKRGAHSHVSYLVQLKSRFSLNRKYYMKNIYIAFVNRPTGDWYLLSYDRLQHIAFYIRPSICKTASWQKHGAYTSKGLSAEMREALSPFIFR